LNQCRDECRRLATELLQSRLGHPHAPKATVPDSLAQNGGDVHGTEKHITSPTRQNLARNPRESY
jgi:hypothetical protein